MNWLGRFRTALGVALLTLVACGGGDSEKGPQPTAPEEATDVALVIARGQDFAPFHYVEDGQLRGFEVEIVRAVAQQLGRRVRFEQYPWSRCLLMARKGRVDAMMNLFQTAERREFLVYRETNVLFHEENTLWRLHERGDVRYDGDPRGLMAHRVGVVRDYSYGARFDEAAKSLQVDQSNDERGLLQKLLHDHVDVIVGNTLVIDWLARQDGSRGEVECLGPPVSREPLYIAFSRARPGSESLADAFGAALARFQETPAYREILRRYGVAPARR